MRASTYPLVAVLVVAAHLHAVKNDVIGRKLFTVPSERVEAVLEKSSKSSYSHPIHVAMQDRQHIEKLKGELGGDELIHQIEYTAYIHGLKGAQKKEYVKRVLFELLPYKDALGLFEHGQKENRF